VRAAVDRFPTLAGRRGAERGYEEGDSWLTEALTGRCRPLAGRHEALRQSTAVVRSPIERSGRCCSTQRAAKRCPRGHGRSKRKSRHNLTHPSVHTSPDTDRAC
jgi:hypothetical protein